MTAEPDHGATVARIAVRSTVWTTLGNYAGQAIGFAALLLLTRALTPETFGYFALGSFWVGVLSLRGKLGLSYATIRQGPTTGALLGTFWGLDVAIVLASLLLTALGAWALTALGLAPEIGQAMLGLMLAEAITALMSPLALALEKELQVSRLTLVNLLVSVAAYAAALGLAWAGYRLVSLLAVTLVTNTLSIIGWYWLCRVRLPEVFTWRWRFDPALARELVRQGLPTGLSLTAVSTLSSQIDNFIVGTWVSPTALGYYDRAYRIASWPNVLINAVIQRVGFLTYAKVKDEPARLAHAVRLSLWIALTGATAMGLGLALNAHDVVAVLYGERWAPAAPLLPFLAVVGICTPMIGTAFWLAVAVGRTRVGAALTFAQLAAIALGAGWLTWRLGLAGTLLGVTVGYAFSFGLSWGYIRQEVKLTTWETLGPNALAAGAVIGLLLGLQAWPGWPALAPFTRLMLALPLIGVVHLGLVALLQWRETVARVRYLRRTWAGAAADHTP